MVHQYKSNGYNIIVDSNSGSVHSVDDVVYDIINLWEKEEKDHIKNIILKKYTSRKDVTSDEIDEVFDDIEELIKDGKLFSDDIFEVVAKQFKARQSVIKAVCLHVAHSCNLRCRYCFADEGAYKGSGKAIMSYETAVKAIEFLIANSGTRKNLEVDFFGGEPLLNWDVVKKTVEYGLVRGKECDKNFRFTLTTNGILLDDEVIEFSNKYMSNVVLSLDGRPEINDKMRVTPNGKGSYDLIVPGFKKLAESRNQNAYYIRGTYTGSNLDFFEDIIHMADMGFKELSMEPVVTDDNAVYAIKKENLPQIYEQYEKLAIEMLARKKNGNPFNFYHYNIDLNGGPCIVKRVSGCGVGTEYVAITPDGDIYPCHQFVGDDEYRLGNVDCGIQNEAIIDKFRNCNIYSHDECKNCFAKLFCSGGCSANAYHMTGDITGVYGLGCDLHRKRIECALMMKVAEADIDN